ncbi:hypothetical protein GCM10009030_19530 [Haloarcula pellucida]|uniref:Uncharacterized protein n=1 Tax=Haloarcula pellucida TaxID=1427151 RepID=A0A830GMK6_9EURY|nr:hypothetical protein GCM10009030_19530 [Halomicroarcula pellucida]
MSPSETLVRSPVEPISHENAREERAENGFQSECERATGHRKPDDGQPVTGSFGA